MCGLLFNGMLALHIEFSCHLVTIIGPQIFIKRLIIACYATPNTCCMGSKDRCNLGETTLKFQYCKTCLPFISMKNNLIFF